MTKPSPRVTLRDGFHAQGVSDWVCFNLVRLFFKTPLRHLNQRSLAVGQRFETTENYVADRLSNVADYASLFSRHCDFQNKRVVELGCATGYLLSAFQALQEFEGIGVDIDESTLRRARAIHGSKIQFVQSTHTKIPLPDEFADIFYCIDTVEHLMNPAELLKECCRILRPGGRFLIYFHPWFGPYGSHLEDIMPFPWPHVFFSFETLLNVSAHIYDSPEYKPACYWYDAETGERRPNPYLDRARWAKFLNKEMTIRGFRRLLRTLPFELVHFERLGFGGKAYPPARLLRGLAQVPVLDEFLVKAVVCVLRKPA